MCYNPVIHTFAGLQDCTTIRCFRRCLVRNMVARLSTVVVTLALLLTACGQGPASSGGATSAPATSATSASATQPTAATAANPTASTASAPGDAIPIGIAVA